MLAVLGFDGFYTLVWMIAAIALGAVVLQMLNISCRASLFIATAGGLGLGMYSLIGLGLGLAGWLNHAVALMLLIGPVVIWIVSLLAKHRDMGKQIDLLPLRDWLLEPAGFSWLWIIPVASLAMGCVAAALLPGFLWKPLDPHPYDVMSYHLQVPREWFETGRIVPLRHNMFSYFPFNVEIQFLLMMHLMGGPWAGMYACQFLNVGYTALMLLAIAGAGDFGERSTFNAQRSTSKGSGVFGAAFVSVVPWVLMLAGVAYVESGLMLYTALSIAWALRALDTRATTEPSGSARLSSPKSAGGFSALLLAGAMAGFACGVKFTAVPMLLLALPGALFTSMLFYRPLDWPLRRLLIGCAGFVLAGSIIMSPWLIRNFAWTGNPIWPLAMNTLGKGHFSDGQVTRFRIAHSPTAKQQSLDARAGLLWEDVIAHWEYGYVLLPAGLLAIAWRWRDRQSWVLLITGLVILIVWIGFTHLLPRFLVMVIPIMGIAIARLRWGRLWPVGIVVLLVASITGYAGFGPELLKQSAVAADSAVFGIIDLSVFLPPELADAKNGTAQVGLVGDAQAFYYQIPMNRLHYRSVFDLPADATDPVDAWVGPQPFGDPHYLLMVNTSEIDRVHKTYYQVPGLPSEWIARYPQTFVVRGDRLPSTIRHPPGN